MDKLEENTDSAQMAEVWTVGRRLSIAREWINTGISSEHPISQKIMLESHWNLAPHPRNSRLAHLF